MDSSSQSSEFEGDFSNLAEPFKFFVDASIALLGACLSIHHKNPDVDSFEPIAQYKFLEIYHDVRGNRGNIAITNADLLAIVARVSSVVEELLHEQK